MINPGLYAPGNCLFMRKHRLISDKLIFTLMTVFIYMMGRFIPLCGVDTSGKEQVIFDVQTLLTQSIGGDLFKTSIFALGVFPYITSSILVQMVVMCMKSENKARISPIKMNRYSMLLMIILSIMQAITRIDDLNFVAGSNIVILLYKFVAIIQMITGAIIIYWLAKRNKRYGIGGQTALIFMNILDGIRTNIFSHDFHSLIIPLIIGCIGLYVMLIMENAEKRIPMQSIAIYSIYGEENYLAIKCNPIGVMPMMFATTFFMLPQLVVRFLLKFNPYNERFKWFLENDVLYKPMGIAIYIFILYLLTISFSFLMVSPKDLTERNQKSGDSLVGIRSGKETLSYLRKRIFNLAFFSATVMAICIGTPMLLQLSGRVDSSLAMIPTSIMMLTGLACNLYQEVRAVRSLDSYVPFI